MKLYILNVYLQLFLLVIDNMPQIVL